MLLLSPTACCTWSVFSCALFAFLVGHIWSYDRFACLKWSASPYNGAFKRLMTYTYLLSIPMMVAYSIGFTWIKYQEGYTKIIGFGNIPSPYVLWPQAYQNAIFPLLLVFSFAWSLEMITHLEELCFWYFLFGSGPTQQDWFKSRYSKLWIGGSVTALMYIPLIVILNRMVPLKCEALTFLAGSSGDFALTLGFLPILWQFPKFVEKLRADGVEQSVITKLQRFYELNIIRVVFRCFMFIPLFILGTDGVVGISHPINRSPFWSDLLVTFAAFGCAFSSVCTILIFFPRSYDADRYANNGTPPSESPESTPSKTINNFHPYDHSAADSDLHLHHQHELSFHPHRAQSTASSHFKLKRSKSSSTAASAMAKELRRTPVKRVLSRIRRGVHMPVPQALRRKESQLTVATDVHPFNYPRECEEGSVASIRGRRAGTTTSNATRTYLLTDSPVLEATAVKTKESTVDEDEDVHPYVLDRVDTPGGVGITKTRHSAQVPRKIHHAHRPRSSSPPPPCYEAGSSRLVAESERWQGMRKGEDAVTSTRQVTPHCIDLNVNSRPLPHMPMPCSPASPATLESTPPLYREEKYSNHSHHYQLHTQRSRGATYPPYAEDRRGDGSKSTQRRSQNAIQISNDPREQFSTSPTPTAATISTHHSRLTAANLKEHDHRLSRLNPLVLTFLSPLDVVDRNYASHSSRV